ncbi:putative von Willebrand factor, type A [Magnetofaba australis IT-1]|uniref:Putative von Willebrand factor, type A n=2 Tax=Magnetofaba TaxID=1472292 RepID=A0A1Y2K2Y9_9PROT|nr:putative von Willebrand factor, type A [Magnetofaba australis IT-1]
MDPEQKGLAIAQEADKRDTGFVDMTADMRMVLKNRHGESSERQMRMRTKEVSGDGDMSLSVFDTPHDVKGTAMLTHSHALEADDQWMYLPALKRVKRIASRNKSGPFMGSEFAFEDLGSQEVEKYAYKWLRDEELDGHPTHVVERYPKYDYSGYTRQVAWMDKGMMQPLKVDYYDRKNDLLKTQTFSGYNQYLDQFWRPNRMYMINHQTHKSTELSWSNYQFRVGLKERDFDRSGLKRAR